ncbi:MAG TPA: hypothetical protein PK360_01935 [bacterium]|nr:hypothetical protein [bacterium]
MTTGKNTAWTAVPNCGGPLQHGLGKESVRTRIAEDLLEAGTPEVTEHRIHRGYGPRRG